MGNPSAKRKRPEGMGFRKPKKVRKFKKQVDYYSSGSEDEGGRPRGTDFKPVDMSESEGEEGETILERRVRKKAAQPPVDETPAAEPTPAAAKAAPVAAKDPELKSALKKTKKPEPSSAAKKSEKPSATKKSEKPSATKKTKQPDPPSASDDEEDEEIESEDDDDDDGVNVEDLSVLDNEDDSDMEDDEVDLSDDESNPDGKPAQKRKRNDPTAFATSMSKILSTKLTTTKRQDPVLSRSAAATASSKDLADAKLEAKAKRKMHAEKREALEKGRVRDVLGVNSTDVSTADIQERERRLQKTAQRGVVKLFNAVRAAQVKGEQARAETLKEGVVGISQRDEKVTEMSKKGFLDLIASGGKKSAPVEV